MSIKQDHDREIIQEMLGRKYKLGDGNVYRINTISGPHRSDVMNFRCIGKVVRTGYKWFADNDPEAILRKIPCGVAMDALYHGLIEEVFEEDPF